MARRLPLARFVGGGGRLHMITHHHEYDSCDGCEGVIISMVMGLGTAEVPCSGTEVIGADVIVSAIGVTPATHWLPPELPRASDGGLLVDGRLCCLTGAPALHGPADGAVDADAHGAADADELSGRATVPFGS
eukprot:scaffold235313_cov17-Tisochrysis_lutea.AAC.1